MHGDDAVRGDAVGIAQILRLLDRELDQPLRRFEFDIGEVEVGGDRGADLS